MSEARISLTPRTRLLTIAGVAALHLAAIVALVTAFGIETVITSVRSVTAFDVPIPPPPPFQVQVGLSVFNGEYGVESIAGEAGGVRSTRTCRGSVLDQLPAESLSWR